MRYRQLGSSDLQVSEISLGSWLTYGGGVEREQAEAYQCHRYDWKTPLEETMEALTEVVRQGKARYLGFSEWPVEKVREALALPNVEKLVSSQPQYSLLWRGPDDELIPFCAENGISQIVWSPKTNDAMNFFMDRVDDDTLLERIQLLRPIADELGITMAQLALAWVLREPNVASAIVGASRPQQLEDNAAASGVDLSPEILGRIDEALGDVVSHEGPAS